MLKVCLASTSPRRRDLLEQVGIGYLVIAPEVEETPRPGETGVQYVQRLASLKARHVVSDLPVVAADTAVCIEGEILGKPGDIHRARQMLKRLSGMTHQVITAVSVRLQDRQLTRVSESQVTFADMTDQEIDSYCASGEPLDKAGGYGIQGIGAAYIKHISGSYSGVVGLPLYELFSVLKEMEISSP